MTDTDVQAVEKLDLDELSRSLTGFDEIAIEVQFKRGIAELSGTIQARALLFIALRRDGAKDADAFRQVMTMRIDEVEDHFEIPDEDADEVEAGKGEPSPATRSTPSS